MSDRVASPCLERREICPEKYRGITLLSHVLKGLQFKSTGINRKVEGDQQENGYEGHSPEDLK